MARKSFSAENRTKSTNFDFPKLSLKKDERARVLFVEYPEVFYYHEMRAPEVDEHGVPIMGTATNRAGESYQINKMKFVGNPLCTGKEDTLEDESSGGIDPENCIVCAQVNKYPKRFAAPRRRYVAHVIRYRTASGSFNPTKPFSVELLVWAFADKKFNSLIDIAEEHGDLLKKDLLLGPCTNESFQNFDIQVGSDALALQSEERAQLIRETFEGNKVADLSLVAGRRKEERFLVLDIKQVNDQHDLVDMYERRASGKPAPATSTGLGEDLSSLLDDVNEAPAKAEPAKKAELPWEDKDEVLEDLSNVNTTTGEISAPAKEKTNDALASLDDLLGI